TIDSSAWAFATSRSYSNHIQFPPMFRLRFPLLLLSLSLFAAACDDAASGFLGDECSADSDCNPGLFCEAASQTCHIVEDLRALPDMVDAVDDTTDDAMDAVDTLDGDADGGDECQDGEEGICGEQLGECTPGTRICVDGMWGPCEGGSGPTDEVCDGFDNDCDGMTDEQESGTALQEDCGTNEGECVAGIRSCTEGGTWGPCKAAIGPQPEVCDGKDNNCDGILDNDAQDNETWYADIDQDGFGDPMSPKQACAPGPRGYVQNNTDCDDGNTAINPDATEVCDMADNDCDTFVDEGDAAPVTWYADTDDDGYGDLVNTLVACQAPVGYVADSSDCDDAAVAVNPGATEVCNMIDDNCINGIDEGPAAPPTWYADTDNDGYGDAANTLAACMRPMGYVSNSGDCNDMANAINPGATEVCNLIDDNCINGIDEGVENTWYADTDGDG